MEERGLAVSWVLLMISYVAASSSFALWGRADLAFLFLLASMAAAFLVLLYEKEAQA